MPLKQLQKECLKRKLRLTADRELAFKIISEQKQPIKAYDLLDIFKKYKKNSKPPTIYRALDFLQENGFIHKINILNSFCNCTHMDDEHNCQLFICNQCNKVNEYCNNKILEEINSEANDNAFSVRNIVTEIYGICRECNEQK
ncbi:MAG: transcriptional repressor [Rickettsiales bacterium]|nr:transcriptional repressor [Rickettsiales bacterium]